MGAAARLVGMGVPQFTKNFKQVAGMTLVAHLNHVRLANAARLLRATDRTIADIADTTGFSDQSYFDKRFKRAFGRGTDGYAPSSRLAGGPFLEQRRHS